MKKILINTLIIPISILMGIILIWMLLARIIDNQFILPTLGQTIESIINLAKQAQFYRALFSTIFRALISFLLSFLIALGLAYLSKKRTTYQKIIFPFISIIRALPTVAVTLLLVFWVNNKIAPVIVTMLVVLPTTYTNLTNAFDSVDKDAITMCEFFGVEKKQVFFKVQLPQMAPPLCLALGAGLALNLKLMVAAEVLSQTAYSLGFMMQNAKAYFEIAEMISIVIIVVLIALVVEIIFSNLSKKVGKWQ